MQKFSFLQFRYDLIMLVFHHGLDLLFGIRLAQQVGIGDSSGQQYFAFVVNQGFNGGIGLAFIFGLNMKHFIPVFDIGIKSNIHTNMIIKVTFNVK